MRGLYRGDALVVEFRQLNARALRWAAGAKQRQLALKERQSSGEPARRFKLSTELCFPSLEPRRAQPDAPSEGAEEGAAGAIVVADGDAAAVLQLRDYQREGVEWMLFQGNHPEPRGSILADEMGLGKTIQVACLLQLLSMGTLEEREADPRKPPIWTMSDDAANEAAEGDAQRREALERRSWRVRGASLNPTPPQPHPSHAAPLPEPTLPSPNFVHRLWPASVPSAHAGA